MFAVNLVSSYFGLEPATLFQLVFGYTYHLVNLPYSLFFFISFFLEFIIHIISL